jgi:hypothetical protein
MSCSRNTSVNIIGTCCRSAQNATGTYNRWALPLLAFLLVWKHPSTLKMSWKRSVKEAFGYRTDDRNLFSDIGREVCYRGFCWIRSNVTCHLGKVDAASVTYAMRVIHFFCAYCAPSWSNLREVLLFNYTGTIGLIWNVSWNDIFPSRAVYFLRYIPSMKKK